VDFASRNRFYHHTTLWRGEAFTSDGGHIKKYDAVKNAWQVLEISDVGNCELFAVNGQLYAATPNLIVEILEGGTRTHILASNRRQPPVSALDTENLGTPALFTGPGRSLRAAAGNKIVAWDGENWRTVCPAPQAHFRAARLNVSVLQPKSVQDLWVCFIYWTSQALAYTNATTTSCWMP